MSNTYFAKINDANMNIDVVRRRPKILIVDDQVANIKIMQNVFDEGYELFFALNGQDALGLSLSNAPDIILLDIELGEMNGLEVCAKLKEDPATENIPIIFVTSHDSIQQETTCWEAGGVDFIHKPINAVTTKHRVNIHLKLKEQSDLLLRLAYQDGLTHLANRRHLDQILDKEWLRGKRSRFSVALIMIDIDHFKQFNDVYGHQEGDSCLQKVASALRLSIHRPDDIVARYGGEEFCCLLPNTDVEGAELVATNIANAVNNLNIPHEKSLVSDRVTLSMGVSVMFPSADNQPSDLIKSADELLYQAKNLGRSTIAYAKDLPSRH